jgi:hypothetical protein
MIDIGMYFGIGIIWCFIVDTVYEGNKMDKYKMFRFIVFWPITLIAFCMGFIIGWYNDRDI